MNNFLKTNDIWYFSITVTGRCNCACTYCHYYANRNRKDYIKDIDFELFKNYVHLLKLIKEKYHKNISVRFSGGDPLVLGEKLFELSNYLYKETGIKPYILTNGKALNKEIIEKSIENNILGYIVSLENPFDTDKGAPRTIEILEKIKTLNSDELMVHPGVMIIKNNMFKHLFKICDFVYEEIGLIPTLSELTYGAYESPSDKDLEYLYDNIYKLFEKYYYKTDLMTFPYVSPELFFGDRNHYLTELDIDNKFNICSDNITEIYPLLIKQLNKSYIFRNCSNKDCDWYPNCERIKWIWTQDTNGVTAQEKMRDYCRFKKTINSAVYAALIEKE